MRRVFRLFSTDYYQLLQIPKTASKIEIKKAYFDLAKKYHPDASTGNAEMFRNISAAYEVLSNESKRAAFDMSLKQGSASQNRGSRRTRGDRTSQDQMWMNYWTQASNPWGGSQTPNKDKDGYKDDNGPMSAILDMLAVGSFTAFVVGSIYYLVKFFRNLRNTEPEPEFTSPTFVLKVPERKTVDLATEKVEPHQPARISRNKFSET